MVGLRLDTIPAELLASIARNSDVRAVLSLASTNHALRAACYDGLVFRSLIETSLKTHWDTDQSDMAAIARRAGSDLGIWARFALADGRAAALAQTSREECSDARAAEWLAELLVVNHPIVRAPGLNGLLVPAGTRSQWDFNFDKVDFGLVLKMLARVAAEPSLAINSKDFRGWRGCWSDWPAPRSDVYKSLFQMLCYVHDTSRMFGLAWPYDHHAVVPHIRLPDLSLHFLSTATNVPVPFVSQELCDDGSWSAWHEQQSRAILLSGGAWCGYYSGWSDRMIDPPMMDINFVIGDRTEAGVSTVRADECVDGHGTFKVAGDFVWADMTFRGTKLYTSENMRNLCWTWNLQLTPLGWHGYWGQNDAPRNMNGMVWLWKQEWSPKPARR